jgi:prefoldin subunit 5
MRQYPIPYSHPYARQAQWNFHAANNSNGMHAMPSMMNVTSSEQDMAGGVAVHVDDLKQTFETLADDVETLRRVITQQQQIIEALRHQQGIVSNDAARHETAIMELVTLRPSRDAWVAQADASIRSSAQQCGALHSRVEQLTITCHERPSREEMKGAITSAVEPLSKKLDVLDVTLHKMPTVTSGLPSTQMTDDRISALIDSRVRGAILDVMSSLKNESSSGGLGQSVVAELEEAKLALNSAKQQLAAQTQHYEMIISQHHHVSQSVPTSKTDPAAMDEYWKRIQGFVSSKLVEFEARISHRLSTSAPSSSQTTFVAEERMQVLEKSLKDTNNTVSGLEAQIDKLRTSQDNALASSLKELRTDMCSDIREAIANADVKKVKEVSNLVETAVTKESTRWERKLEEALEATVSRCRSACNADAKYNIERAMTAAEVSANRLVESSRSNVESVFTEAERRLRASVEESRESINRGARKVAELEDRVEQVQRAVRGDMRKLRDDFQDSSMDNTMNMSRYSRVQIHK